MKPDRTRFGSRSTICGTRLAGIRLSHHYISSLRWSARILQRWSLYLESLSDPYKGVRLLNSPKIVQKLTTARRQRSWPAQSSLLFVLVSYPVNSKSTQIHGLLIHLTSFPYSQRHNGIESQKMNIATYRAYIVESLCYCYRCRPTFFLTSGLTPWSHR